MSEVADCFWQFNAPDLATWAEAVIRDEEAELETLLLLQFDPLEEGESERV
jgi:hypothetical protein